MELMGGPQDGGVRKTSVLDHWGRPPEFYLHVTQDSQVRYCRRQDAEDSGTWRYDVERLVSQ